MYVPHSESAMQRDLQMHMTAVPVGIISIFVMTVLALTTSTKEDGEVYPDPSTFEDGWISEEQGQFQWLSVYLFDIQEYLGKTAVGCDFRLKHHLLNEYITGKVHR